jgi:hypothetical protein
MNRLCRCRAVATAIIAAVCCLVLLAGCGGGSGSKSADAISTTGTAATPSTTASTATSTPGTSTHITKGGATTGTTDNASPSAQTPSSSSAAQPKTQALHRAITTFVTCLSENGVKIAPNTTGKNPLLSLKGVDTSSPQFRAADKKCAAALRAALKSTAGQSPNGSAASPAPSAPPATAKLKANVPPKIRHALEHFTACMREHGITSFPEPEGARFNTSHLQLDRSSAQYKAAEGACNPILNAVF